MVRVLGSGGNDRVGDRASMSIVGVFDLVHWKHYRHPMHSSMWNEPCFFIEKLNLLVGTTQSKFIQSNYLQVLISDEEQDALSTDPDELLDSDDSDGIIGDEEDIFCSLLARAGFHLRSGDNPPHLQDPSQLQVTLREKLLMDAGAVAAFLAGVFFCSPHMCTLALSSTLILRYLLWIKDYCLTCRSMSNDFLCSFVHNMKD